MIIHEEINSLEGTTGELAKKRHRTEINHPNYFGRDKIIQEEATGEGKQTRMKEEGSMSNLRQLNMKPC